MADIHILLCVAVAGCAAAVAAEGALRGSGALAPTAARAFFTLLQGTWFCQAARSLYGARGDSRSRKLGALLTALLGGGCRICALGPG